MEAARGPVSENSSQVPGSSGTEFSHQGTIPAILQAYMLFAKIRLVQPFGSRLMIQSPKPSIVPTSLCS